MKCPTCPEVTLVMAVRPDDYRDSKDDYRKDYYRKKRKSFLSEIFD